METVAVYLGVTFLAGLAAVLVRLPPLVGFLAAGFILNGLGVPEVAGLETVADLGVTLLLFGVGLKFDARSLLAREVWLTASVHMLAFGVAAGAGLALLGLIGAGLLGGLSLGTCALLGFALSFSSTVYVVKALEATSDAESFYGRIAIGILIFQDFAAVIFLTASKGTLPSPWALLLVGLLPLAVLMRKVWNLLPHGEMHSVFGIMMALVPGYAAFEIVGLKGDLGALIVGMLLAGHKGSDELSNLLFQIKEMLLVGFFLSIGLTGLPTLDALLLGLGALVLLPLKVTGFVWILHRQMLRRRTATMAGLVMGNYSEFGLIVIAVGADAGLVDEGWLVVVAVAVAGSFVMSSLLTRRNERTLRLARERLSMHPPDKVHPHERPIEVGDARAVVLGMGRIGKATYRELTDAYGVPVLGVENNSSRVAALQEQGFNVVDADATDADFWDRLQLTGSVEIAVLAMPFHGSNLDAFHRLREASFDGVVAAVAQYEDQMREMREAGVDVAVHLYEGVGVALAERAAGAAEDRDI